MDASLHNKLYKLTDFIKQHSSAIVAFSGGTDSTLLAFICKQLFGENLLLVTATSSIYSQSELNDAISISSFIGLKPFFLQLDVFNIPEFANNPPDRCYYCKRELFSRIKLTAEEMKISAVFDGSNLSDEGDFRPGKRALKELGIISPLTVAGITKAEVYTLSHYFNLPTAHKATMACLASRFPYGELITKDKLERVETAEKEFHDLGYHQLRIRSHGDLARLEISAEEIEQAFSNRNQLVAILKKSGFTWCSLDLQGYRTGAMNETLRT